jgi:hypothetical protein
VADGLLTIELVRQVPEAMKPKQIPCRRLRLLDGGRGSADRAEAGGLIS